jgi:hypothetical protein
MIVSQQQAFTRVNPLKSAMLCSNADLIDDFLQLFEVTATLLRTQQALSDSGGDEWKVTARQTNLLTSQANENGDDWTRTMQTSKRCPLSAPFSCLSPCVLASQ